MRGEAGGLHWQPKQRELELRADNESYLAKTQRLQRLLGVLCGLARASLTHEGENHGLAADGAARGACVRLGVGWGWTGGAISRPNSRIGILGWP
jgi:hypothetical protein